MAAKAKNTVFWAAVLGIAMGAFLTLVVIVTLSSVFVISS